MAINTQGFGIQLAPAGFPLEANKIFENYEKALTFVRTHPAAYEGSVITVKAPSTIDGTVYPAGVYEVKAVGPEGRIEQVGKETDLSGIELAIEKRATKDEVLFGIRFPEVIVVGQPVLFTIDAPDPILSTATVAVYTDNGQQMACVAKGGGLFEMTFVDTAKGNLKCSLNVRITRGELSFQRFFNIVKYYPPVFRNSSGIAQITGEAGKTSAGDIHYESSPINFEMEQDGDVLYVGFLNACAPAELEVYDRGQIIPMENVPTAEIPKDMLVYADIAYRSPGLKMDPEFTPSIKAWKMS